MSDLIDIISPLLGKPETPTLEFKQEWYWNNTTPLDEKGKRWGELIKDIISLANAYSGGHTGKTRYLIIGANEAGEIFHIESNDIKEFKNRQTTSFHNELRKKLSEHTTPSLLDYIPDFKFEFLRIDEKDILVFQIPSPYQYIKLKKNLQTKTKTFDDGSVLVREGDSVKAASPEIIFSLKDEFKLYADNSHKVKAPEKNFPRKERSIQKTVDAYLKQNASYSQIKKDSDRKDNIIYEVFTLSNSLSSSYLYFVYIHEDASQKATFGYLKGHKIISSGDVIILTERPAIKKIDERKANLEKFFKSVFAGSAKLCIVSFIDEFGINRLYKNCITEYTKYDVLYIDSDVHFEQSQKLSALKALKMWYERDANPLLIIKGHGGIGKTTLVKHFLDSVYEENKEKGILFIDSNEIIDRLTRQSSSENKKLDDLFNFYQAQITEEYDNNQFTPDLFQLSIDNGSLLVVLDGIDEVIAKLGSKFNYAVLLKSIRDYYSSNLEKTKIIITCRESFLKEIENDDNWFSEVVLKPFDRPTAIKFFEQVFLSETKKTEKAMKLADKFANNEKNGSAFVYIPYTLDLICDLVREDNSISEDTLQSSDFGGLLSEKEPNDFIIGSICRRESKKLGFKDINSQIDLFIQIATNQDTHINICNMKPMWARVRGVNQDTISDQDISKLEGHPLLTRNGDNFSFKYDFIGYFFKILCIVKFLREKGTNYLTNNQEILTVFAGYVKYGYDFTLQICNRLKDDDDDALQLFCADIVEKLQKEMNGDFSKPQEQEYKKVISSIFIFLITRLNLSGKNNKEYHTQQLTNIFGTNPTGCCLIDITSNNNTKKLILDFRGMKLINCTFDNFEYFWDCLVDEKTVFINSVFKSLPHEENGKKVAAFINTFGSGCDTEDIKFTLNKSEHVQSEKSIAIISYLESLFKIFYTSGRFLPQKQEFVRSRAQVLKIPERYIKKLIDFGVIEDYKDPKKPPFQQYRIVKKFEQYDMHHIIGKFINNGDNKSEIIRRIIKICSE